MSASKKLRALEAKPVTNVLEQTIVALSLTAALPQIVAVVEAAERTADSTKTGRDMRAALTALDEALS